MYVILWLIFGGFAGWIASILTNKNNQMGLIANIVFGVIGSFVGGWLASLLKIGSFNTFSFGGLLIAVGGAVVLIFVVNLLFPSK